MSNPKRRNKRDNRKNILLKKENQRLSMIIKILTIFALILLCIFSARKIVDTVNKNSQIVKNEITKEQISNDENKSVDKKYINISLVGNIYITKDMINYGKNYADILTKNIQKYISTSNIGICNLKTEIDDENKIFLKGLNTGGINIFNNNTSNIEKTKLKLDELKIDNVDEKSENRVKLINNLGDNIAIISYNTEASNTISNIYNEENAKNDLVYSKENAICTVVLMNYGKDENEESKKEKATFLIKNGASIVAGIGENCISLGNVEIIKNENNYNSIYINSLGNFINNSLKDEENIGLLTQIKLDIGNDGKVENANLLVDKKHTFFYDLGDNLVENRYKVYNIEDSILDYDKNSENKVIESIYNKLKEIERKYLLNN